MKKIRLIQIMLLIGSVDLSAEVFKERIAVYGIVKPAMMTTMLAVNHGMVTRIPAELGDPVAKGDVLIEVMEKETTRAYRSGIKGGVAKLHVTNGAAVTPGMPLSTVIDPAQKHIEVSLSPKEAILIKAGAEVSTKDNKAFGVISKISPLVDPDTGAVTAYVKPGMEVKNLIGDVIPMEIVSREITNCKTVALKDVEDHLSNHKIEAVSGTEACLVPANVIESK